MYSKVMRESIVEVFLRQAIVIQVTFEVHYTGDKPSIRRRQ